MHRKILHNFLGLSRIGRLELVDWTISSGTPIIGSTYQNRQIKALPCKLYRIAKSTDITRRIFTHVQYPSEEVTCRSNHMYANNG